MLKSQNHNVEYVKILMFQEFRPMGFNRLPEALQLRIRELGHEASYSGFIDLLNSLSFELMFCPCQFCV